MTALTIPAQFAEQVGRTPSSPAVHDVANRTSLTYLQLDEKSNRLAHYLLTLGVQHEDRVAVMMQRSADLIVAYLAILKTGGTFLPIHDAYPSHRQRFLVEHSEAVALLTDENNLELLSLSPSIPVFNLKNMPLHAQPSTDPHVPLHPAQLAYVMHTSGSTGEPKGVAVAHQDVVKLLIAPPWDNDRHTRLLLLAPHAFDVSTYEIWTPLLHGGHIVIPPPGHLDSSTLEELIGTHNITALHLTAGLFRVLAEEAPHTFTRLFEVLTGGDTISPTAIQKVLRVCPHLVIHAMYGTTEGTVFSAHHEFTSSQPPENTVPLGRHIEGVQIYVLDDHLDHTHEVGEIYLGGQGVARGYLHQSELTAEHFVADPHGAPGSRMYRTGDLGRHTSHGLLEFVGRDDNQLKILGFVVEPSEVEAALSAHPGIAQLVVLPRALSEGEKQLICYVVPVAPTLDLGELRARAQEMLPEYMRPAAFVLLDHLPLTPNGKLDREAMPTPAFADVRSFRKPTTSLQHQICQFFQDLLEVPDVGLDDSFFDLGGQSLQATRLLNRIKTEIGIKILMNILFDSPTVGQLANYIETQTGLDRVQENIL